MNASAPLLPFERLRKGTLRAQICARAADYGFYRALSPNDRNAALHASDAGLLYRLTGDGHDGFSYSLTPKGLQAVQQLRGELMTVGLDLAAANERDQSVSSIMRGARLLYTLQPGEKACLMGTGDLLVVHPDRKPRLIDGISGKLIGEVRV